MRLGIPSALLFVACDLRVVRVAKRLKIGMVMASLTLRSLSVQVVDIGGRCYASLSVFADGMGR